MTKKYLGFCAALLLAVGVSVPAKAQSDGSYVRGGYGLFSWDETSGGDYDTGGQVWLAAGFYPDWGADIVDLRVEGEVVPWSKVESSFATIGGGTIDGELTYWSGGANILAEHELASGVYGALGVGAGIASWEHKFNSVEIGSSTDLYYQLMAEGRVDFTKNLGGLLQVNYFTLSYSGPGLYLRDDNGFFFRAGLQYNF